MPKQRYPVSLSSWELLIGVLLVGMVGGCRPPTTEIVLGLATDLTVPDELDRVELRVTRAGVEIQRLNWRLSITDPDIVLPDSYALYTDGDIPTVDITLTGFRGQQERVQRRATVSFVREKTLFLRLALVQSCVGRFECPTGQDVHRGEL